MGNHTIEMVVRQSHGGSRVQAHEGQLSSGARACTVQRAVERREKIIVGVNDYIVEEKAPLETLYIDQEVSRKQIARLRELKTSRSDSVVQESLESLRRAARSNDNLMPHFIACARNYVTLGEMCDTLRAVFGTYVEPRF